MQLYIAVKCTHFVGFLSFNVTAVVILGYTHTHTHTHTRIYIYIYIYYKTVWAAVTYLEKKKRVVSYASG